MVAQLAASHAGPLVALASAVDTVAAEPLDGLTDTALADDLVAVRREIDRLEADFCRRLRRYEAAVRSTDGGESAMVLLRRRSGMSSSEVAQRRSIARHLDVIPAAVETFATGDITVRHAAVLARCVEDNGAANVAPAAAALMDAARHLDADQLRDLTRHLRHCVNPDGALADATVAHERRWLHISKTWKDVVIVDGVLDTEGGALVRTAIEALATRQPDDRRSPAQRRADALVELARRQLQAGDLPTSRGVRPHLVVTAPLATTRGDAGAPAASLSWGGIIVAETARRLACDSVRTEVRTTPDGEPLSVERTRRTVPASLRRALDARDGGCRYPGCGLPAQWTDAHHIRHWADGGETRLDNLVLLCRRHHRMLHEGGQAWAEVSSGGGRSP